MQQGPGPQTELEPEPGVGSAGGVARPATGQEPEAAGPGGPDHAASRRSPSTACAGAGVTSHLQDRAPAAVRAPLDRDLGLTSESDSLSPAPSGGTGHMRLRAAVTPESPTRGDGRPGPAPRAEPDWEVTVTVLCAGAHSSYHNQPSDSKVNPECQPNSERLRKNESEWPRRSGPGLLDFRVRVPRACHRSRSPPATARDQLT